MKQKEIKFLQAVNFLMDLQRYEWQVEWEKTKDCPGRKRNKEERN